MKRVLISVSNKDGVLELGKSLHQLGYQLLSTGSCAAIFKQAGLAVTLVEQLTGFPEMLDGRLKTLHPAIHGGLLARRDCKEHLQQLALQQFVTIDMVVVNFYPFEQVMAEQADWDTLIENIDIGGPTMVRSAAKNHRHVVVLSDPLDYPLVLKQLHSHGEVDLATRALLALKALRQCSYYDSIISSYLGEQLVQHCPLSQEQQDSLQFPATLTVALKKQDTLRYGENPHQQAALYRRPTALKTSLLDFKQLHGKPLSYNNLQDADAALRLVRSLAAASVVVVKHCNPCGVGSASSLAEAWQKAYNCDKVSIFGGIIALNRCLELEVAEQIANIFIEVVLAPDFSPESLSLLQKKKNIRLLQVASQPSQQKAEKLLSIDGGLLWWQEGKLTPSKLELACGSEPTQQQQQQLELAWKVVAALKSNAIALVKDGATIGIGAGQMNRVAAMRLALEQAGSKAQEAVLASDAFFPFSDCVELAAQAGVSAIIQPGGSIRDRESLALCQRYGISMLYTGRREFVH